MNPAPNKDGWLPLVTVPLSTIFISAAFLAKEISFNMSFRMDSLYCWNIALFEASCRSSSTTCERYLLERLKKKTASVWSYSWLYSDIQESTDQHARINATPKSDPSMPIAWYWKLQHTNTTNMHHQYFTYLVSRTIEKKRKWIVVVMSVKHTRKRWKKLRGSIQHPKLYKHVFV